MAIQGALLKINGMEVTGLKKYEVDYQNLYTDADRNMNGDVRSTLIGWFPKISVETSAMTPRSQVDALAKILRNPNLVVDFRDSDNTMKQGWYYAGSFKTSIKERRREYYDSMSFDLVPLKNSYR